MIGVLMLRSLIVAVVFSGIALPVWAGEDIVSEKKNVILAQNQAQSPAKSAPAKKAAKEAADSKKSSGQTDSAKPEETAPADQKAGTFDQDAQNIPERRAECMWTGQRIVTLLSRDDINTAREHLNFYDRFGCPKDHITVAFRCAIRQAERQPEQTDISARVYGCWMSPEVAERP